MKKYIKPIAKVVNIDNEELLAGSGMDTTNDSVGYDGGIGGFANQGTWDDFVLEDEEEHQGW